MEPALQAARPADEEWLLPGRLRSPSNHLHSAPDDRRFEGLAPFPVRKAQLSYSGRSDFGRKALISADHFGRLSSSLGGPDHGDAVSSAAGAVDLPSAQLRRFPHRTSPLNRAIIS